MTILQSRRWQKAGSYQPLDSDLTTIAGLTATTDSFMQAKSSAWSARTVAQVLVDLAAPGTTFQPLDADLTAVAASGLAAPWTVFGSTITSSGGTITTASGIGLYLKVGTLVFIELSVFITTNGTGNGIVLATLPITPSTNYFYLAGIDLTVTGKTLQGLIPGASPMQILFYDATYPGATGAVLILSGCYST